MKRKMDMDSPREARAEAKMMRKMPKPPAKPMKKAPNLMVMIGLNPKKKK